MKQVLANLGAGTCTVEDVPEPTVARGAVLVRNRYSLISPGTEGGTVRLTRMSLLGKARARPEQVRKVLEVARTQGALTAWRAARRALDMPVTLGYSSAGVVIAAGEGVTDLAPGDRVACAGQGHASHAEVVNVPRNLCVRLPAAVDARAGAFTTLGAIALQSVRVAEVRLGENVVVLGLGLVGVLAVQCLRAAGCRVLGIDSDGERVDFVARQGWAQAVPLGADNLHERVRAFTDGHGADCVIIAAASDDDRPVALAGELARRKGRVVVVGRTVMRAPRETYLFKELELATSMAYGPGTGDPLYEEHGIDYPIAYVRWTENRNMAAFVDLVAAGRIDLVPLVSEEVPVEEAPAAFERIASARRPRPLAVLLRYPEPPAVPVCTLPLARPVTAAEGALCVSVIGAGSFAANELVPLIPRNAGVRLRAIASASGVRAQALGRKYGFELCTSDAEQVIGDAATDCVLVLTRHDSHARLAAAALAAGKHVLVEKPLALTSEELDEVERAWRASGRVLMVGFNRRYAPLARRLRAFFGTRAQPASILYRANVGYRPPEHWLHDPVQGGGVILGEACHHIDFCIWLTGASPVSVSAQTLGGTGGIIPEDNVHLRLGFDDGSLATVAYLSNGARGCPNERVEVFCDGKIGVVTDWRRLELYRGLRRRRSRLWASADRGHRDQIRAFFAAVRGEGPPPDTESYFASSRAAIEAAAQVRRIADGGR